MPLRVAKADLSQTTDVCNARLRFKKGDLSEADYTALFEGGERRVCAFPGGSRPRGARAWPVPAQ